MLNSQNKEALLTADKLLLFHKPIIETEISKNSKENGSKDDSLSLIDATIRERDEELAFSQKLPRDGPSL